MTFADEVPVIANIAVDWEDRIWVERTGEDGTGPGPTDIVTPDGGYVGTLPADGVRIPSAFGPNGLMAYIETERCGHTGRSRDPAEFVATATSGRPGMIVCPPHQGQNGGQTPTSGWHYIRQAARPDAVRTPEAAAVSTTGR